MGNEVGNERLSPPWYIYYQKLCSLFKEDGQVTIGELEKKPDDLYIAEITVSDKEKQAALQQIIVQDIEIGRTKVKFTFTDPLDVSQADGDVPLETFIAAFQGNPILVKTATVHPPTGATVHYVVFKKEVIQFFADDITDYYGNYNGLAANIAKEVFVPTTVNFGTANGSE